MFKDNRRFIEALEKSGDIVRIKQEVDWDLEAGAIVRRTNEKQGPAALFEKIKDYPAGYRIFGAPLATWRRIAVAMDMPPDSSIKTLQDEYEARLRFPIQPMLVKDAPCKEVIIPENKVDLLQFPVPMYHWGDGGRYLGSWHLVITKDPDSDWTNWGLYRAMVYNRKTLACLLHSRQHQGMIFYNKYLPFKKPMPFVMALCADPLSSMAAGGQYLQGISEVTYAGALAQRPIELVKAETNDLLAPAHSEIIVEGEILPDVMAPEGPFGEFTGFRTPQETRYIYRVKCITHRKDPILGMSVPGMPVDESHIVTALGGNATSKQMLREAGIPIKDMYRPPEAAGHLLIISVNTKEIPNPLPLTESIPFWDLGQSLVMVVDDDINIFNLSEVIHAFATKCHPGRGIKTSNLAPFVALTPYLIKEDRKAPKGYRALFDCTWPRNWSRETDIPPRVSFNEVYPDNIKEKVLKNWRSYGF